NSAADSKLNIADTAAMLSAYATTQGLIDSLTILKDSLQLKLNIADTAAMLSAYAKLNSDITGNAANVTGIVDIANGGTGSSTKSFVDLSTGQSIAGLKTFDTTILVNSITIGTGPGNISTNTVIGNGALNANTTGGENVATGFGTLSNNTQGSSNTAAGVQTMYFNLTGEHNTAFGRDALRFNAAGSNNIAIGSQSGIHYDGVGANQVTSINNAVIIGYDAGPKNNNDSNEIVIGHNAVGNGSNTIQLGNSNITDVKTSGTLTAAGVKTPTGTSAQFLKADGSIDSNSYLVREVADEFSATAAQTSFTLTQKPSATSKVKMYINGIRISNTAYSVVDDVLTYNPANNGSYALSVADRIQFDYYY
ncbi:hypothetical protein, partial [Limnovirga soli]|uniref:hypothetical protein n=1 Tax=Limnovirga soli TaxID=2656915 RepID=UPI001C0F2186